jgi:hypothetical protein
MSNIVINEKKVKYNLKEETPEEKLYEIIDTATTIFKRVLKSNDHPTELFDKLFKEYPDFAKSYPIVLRWMVFNRKYYSDVFEKYLRSIKKPFWGKRDDFLESQSTYVMMTERHRTHMSDKEAKKIKDQVYTMLKDENDKFDEDCKKATDIMKREKKEQTKERLRMIMEELKRHNMI